MSFFDAFLLGLVQGLAEFLPISSSGHLVIAEHLLGVQQNDILFEVFLHLATLIAIFIYFKKDIVSIKLAEIKVIVVASVPVSIIGFLFRDQLKDVFGSIIIVSCLLVVTGILNLITDKKINDSKDKDDAINTSKKEIGIKEALIIGLFQAFSILPGISRSGSTVAGSILQGIDRKKAFRFSFLMVIPVILGASLLQLIEVVDYGAESINFSILAIGGLTAFISGFLSLRIFEYIITRSRLKVFGYYCIGLGVFSLFANYFL